MRAREITARRYAKALFSAAREASSAPAVGNDLDQLLRAFSTEPEVRDVLARPWIKHEDRRAIALSIAKKLGVGSLAQNFAGLLAERGRIEYLPEIADAYRALLDEDFRQARARVRSAVPLADDMKKRLTDRLEQLLGKRIILEEQVDSTLLGGFVAQVGSFILDGSLDGQLARLRERLARG